MHRTSANLAVVCLLTLGVCSPAIGQDTATIVGTVTDITGAVILAAKLVVINAAKGFVRELESNSVGDYTPAKIPVVRCNTVGPLKIQKGVNNDPRLVPRRVGMFRSPSLRSLRWRPTASPACLAIWGATC